jgi:hypothetical protein
MNESVKDGGTLQSLLGCMVGAERADWLLRLLVIAPPVLEETEPQASRAVVAQALNVLLFDDLLARVPAAARYADRAAAAGRTILHDHGAVRTVALAGASMLGGLPCGQESIVRLLRPLGYALHGTYPLEKLRMTGRSYAQLDYPEEMAQFFISELHAERFSASFGETVMHVVGTSLDPLTAGSMDLLGRLERQGWLPVEDAVRLLPGLVGCFGRQHGDVAERDYEALLGESAEMAWIATEGNAFNHVTDRVADVDAVAAEQKELGESLKAVVERSQTGRVRQTAFLAARVVRRFRTEAGGIVEREVPGSFLELITRLPMPEDSPDAGRLDLGFDSSNAQAIFKMTAVS